ncbi:MAG: hypothetical protein AAGK05_17805 [Pseudomonadota bacterium]
MAMEELESASLALPKTAPSGSYEIKCSARNPSGSTSRTVTISILRKLCGDIPIKWRIALDEK